MMAFAGFIGGLVEGRLRAVRLGLASAHRCSGDAPAMNKAMQVALSQRLGSEPGLLKLFPAAPLPFRIADLRR